MKAILEKLKKLWAKATPCKEALYLVALVVLVVGVMVLA